MFSVLPTWSRLTTATQVRPSKQFRDSELRKLPDRSLTALAGELRDQIADGTSDRLTQVAAFALIGEASRRCLGLTFRENQLRAAGHLLARRIVELPTGEGKTLAVTPALAWRALAGRGVWLATSNDYLARRDARQMQPVFALLGLSTGFLQADLEFAARRAAYECDITYGTIREFGFDYLRDQLQRREQDATGRCAGNQIQRELFSIFVDEADSVMLDDARTPLIISEPRPPKFDSRVYQWSLSTGRSLQADIDYFADPLSRAVWLTESGRSRTRQALEPQVLAALTLPEAYQAVVQAIQAETTFQLDRDYILRDGQLVIIDQSTGRLAEGRAWQDGFQQILQVANGLPATPETRPIARITVQAFLRKFEHLSGMTGTAWESRHEFSVLYGLQTVVVPSFHPRSCIEFEAKVFNSMQEKWHDIVTTVNHAASAGRPVLIGTRDLAASRELSHQLFRQGLAHQVLTAEQVEHEAALIAVAGKKGMITVSTCIAGRGTDIPLDADAMQVGGLQVIAADLFDSARIDRQLAGRTGRQGAPGAYQKILSLEDNLLPAVWDSQDVQRKVRRAAGWKTIDKYRLQSRAQHELECRHAQARRMLLIHDDERMRRLKALELNPCLDDVA